MSDVYTLTEARIEAKGVALHLALPNAWELVDVLDPPVAGLVLEPPDGQPFRSSIVVTLEELEPGIDLASWQRTVERQLPQLLHRYKLIDLERRDVLGSEGAVRLMTHLSASGIGVTVEQHVCLVKGHGITLSFTSANPVCQDYRDLWKQISTSSWIGMVDGTEPDAS